MSYMQQLVTPHSILAVGIVMPVLAGIAVGGRIWTRHVHKTALAENDYLILVAYVCLLAVGIMFIWAGASDILGSVTPTAPGPRGFLFINTPKLIATNKMKFAANLINIPAIGFVKLSVLTWYRRIFRGLAFNRITIALMIIICCWIVAVWFAFIFQCSPNFDAFWGTLHDLLTKCNRFTADYNRVVAIPDFVTDVIIVSIPIPLILKLKMDRTKKIGLCFTFLLGAFASGAALARLLIYQSFLTNALANAQGIKVISTWMLWSMIELGISIIAACFPITASLLRSEWFRSKKVSIRSLRDRYVSAPTMRHMSQRHTSQIRDGPSSESLAPYGKQPVVYEMLDGQQNGANTTAWRDIEMGKNPVAHVQKPHAIMVREASAPRWQ